MIPGEYFLAAAPIIANEGRHTLVLGVTNTGDRPIQVGSHFHFFEVNKQMAFDRALAFGMRLNIPAGTAVRFEPGEEKEVELVAFGGSRMVQGFSNLVNAPAATPENLEASLEQARLNNFKTTAP